MEKDIIISGVNIDEQPDLIAEIYERCIKPGYNFVTITIKTNLENTEPFLECAKYLAKNKVYFVFLHAIQRAVNGELACFNKETCNKIKSVAGKYFLGDMIGEAGSSYGCKFKGYYEDTPDTFNDTTKIKSGFKNVEEAANSFINDLSVHIKKFKDCDTPNIASVEATALSKYNAMAGINIPMLELMCGNPEILISSLRGVARAYASRLWGTYVAHEWYGGFRHSDMLKRKRLELAYKYSYMAGSQAFCLESGFRHIRAYGETYSRESDICNDYHKILAYINDLIKNDCRPKGGPMVKFAFVSGRNDAWGGWGGSSVWNQFDNKAWGHSDAEHSWRILDEVGNKRFWADTANYGDKDFSANPAYGMYDIVPVEAPLEVLNKYDYLVFVGWNTMTDEIMDKLTDYTKNGGNLVMCTAHLGYSAKRDDELIMPDNKKLQTLFGAEFTGKIIETNNGIKFTRDSANKSLLYPGVKEEVCDPIYSSGYVTYAEFAPTTAKITAYISDKFCKDEVKFPAVLENKIGKGIATLITSINYPGNPAHYPLYRAVVREMMSASAKECSIKVVGSDKVKYAVYEGNKIYLLNTDYDVPMAVKIACNGKENIVMLDSLELKSINL